MSIVVLASRKFSEVNMVLRRNLSHRFAGVAENGNDDRESWVIQKFFKVRR